MADGGDNAFLYLGGDQVVPRDVTHVIIDRSVKVILRGAFYRRQQLVSVKMHDGVERIEINAFHSCRRLKRIKLIGVREVERQAFYGCFALTDVEFDDKLEIIGANAFVDCRSLRKIKLPSVRTIGNGSFSGCKQLADLEMPFAERIYKYAFNRCFALQRIAIPLKDDIFHLPDDQYRYTQFDRCDKLIKVDIVGGIHNTISSLLLQSWMDDMNSEIRHINQVLPNTHANEKTAAIDQWIRTVLRRMEHYKAEHNKLLKEDTTVLELALWKAKLDEKEDCSIEGRAKKAKIDTAGARNERRITSGANIVIRSVLPFLQLAE